MQTETAAWTERRIGSFLKGLSPNRTPRTETANPKKKKKEEDHTGTSTASANPASASASTGLACTNTTLTPLVLSSPARAADVFEASSPRASAAVQDREQFARVAKQLEHAVHNLAVCPSVSREDKLQIMISLFQKVTVSVAQATGWVGWFPIGGVDEQQRIVFEHTSTAFTADHLTFEDYLCKRLGWSVDRLLCTFDDFIRDIYDPAQPSPPNSSLSLSPAGLQSDPVELTQVASPVSNFNSVTMSLASTPSRTSLLPRSPTHHGTPATPVRTTSQSALSVPSELQAAAESTLLTGMGHSTPSPANTRGTSVDALPEVLEKERNDLSDQLSTLPASHPPPDEPLVVFGQPPPRVLTTPQPRKKAAPRERGGKRRGRRGGKASTSGRKSTKAAPTALDATSSKVKKTKALVQPQAGVQNENDPVTADLALGKRKRVATARWEGVSPDFSAAKKMYMENLGCPKMSAR
ncbi:hypothetical protein K466DRAFT_607313 [Polyporus arcularius HHB13444]|uniref:Uncharacterized protein n=1 Tax=Polyporus arcularius HHB13444 TaxID=1314778 RepID=A0A5C3NX70_9APHY|nr:hypothetical protein K466DRAFT_607313 [Polyporus arcularius HHB13444]